jgi:hypothetical protein
VLQHEPTKVLVFERTVLRFAGFAIRLVKHDQTVLQGKDGVFIDQAPVQIAGQVFQFRFAVPDMSTINHPFFGNARRDGEPRFIKRLQTARTKHLSQNKLIKEIVAFDLLPLLPVYIDSPDWDNNMAMRMIIQASGMGMKNSRHTDFGPRIIPIEPKVFQRTGGTIE